MRKIVLLSLIGAIFGLLLASLAVPALAQRAGGDGADPFQAMLQACQTGDWDAMIAAAREVCGGSVNSMPCGGGASGNPVSSRIGGMMGSRGAIWQ